MAEATLPWGGREGEPVPTRYLVYITNKSTGKQYQIPAAVHSVEDAKKAVLIRHPNSTIDRVARAQKQYVGWEG